MGQHFLLKGREKRGGKEGRKRWEEKRERKEGEKRG